MRRHTFLTIFGLIACQQARGASTDPTMEAPADTAPVREQPLVVGTASGAAPDSEGPRPGESVDEEKTAMSAAFSSQPFDEGWRQTQESKFRAAFAALQRERQLISVECRQTLCKLEILNDATDRRRSIHEVIAKAVNEDDGFLGSHSFAQYGSTDRLRATVYVSRNHYSLPTIDGRVLARPKVRPTQ
jgi:hypothetical protein